MLAAVSKSSIIFRRVFDGVLLKFCESQDFSEVALGAAENLNSARLITHESRLNLDAPQKVLAEDRGKIYILSSAKGNVDGRSCWAEEVVIYMSTSTITTYSIALLSFSQ